MLKCTKKIVPKGEIIADVAEKAAVSRVVADRLYYAFAEVYEKKLMEGRSIVIPYVGKITFARTKPMRSNLTGQMIPAHHRLMFKFVGKLAQYVKVMSREN